MQAKFGAIVIEGTGKIGGQAFSRTGGRQKLSAISFGTKKKRINSFVAFGSFRYMTNLWKTLTPAQQGTWDKNLLPGESPFNLFVKCNCNRRASGLGAIMEFSVPVASIFLATFSIVASSSAQTIITTSTQGITGSVRSHISLSPQQSPGVAKNARGMSMCDYGTAGSTFARNLSAAYIARYGALKAGKKIFYKLESFELETGFPVFVQEGFTIVT